MIKKQFCGEPILKVYDPELPMRVKCDASEFATGGILSQKHNDGLWHPVPYHSQSMSKEEHNYKIYNREMRGLIHALEDWHHFLEGITFEVIMNHKNMKWWSTMQDLNRRQARWSLYLSRFNLKVTYRKGESMQADTLSRFTQDHVHNREDNQQLCVLGPQHFEAVAAAHYKPASTDSLRDCIRLASQ